MNNTIEYSIRPIGFVNNSFKDLENAPRLEMMAGVSVIEVLEEFEEGLTNIEKEEFINITFYFHLQDGTYELSSDHIHFFNEPRGVFACRSPKRPNSLGTTIVKLIKRDGNKLFVTGFDAIDGTPIIDIKNGNTPLLETHKTYIPRYESNPRVDIEALLDKQDFKALQLKSAQMHNHICPGLTYGVIAGAIGMAKFKEQFGDYKQVQATTTTNSCFVDGVQVVTGASVGNKGLSIEDQGIMGVKLIKKGTENGVLVKLKDNAKEILAERIPEIAHQQGKSGDKNAEKTPEEMTAMRAEKFTIAQKMVEDENISEIFEISTF